MERKIMLSLRTKRNLFTAAALGLVFALICIGGKTVHDLIYLAGCFFVGWNLSGLSYRVFK